MKTEERKLARGLRKQGWSLRAISKQTKCSKSSVSNWIRDIPLTDKQIVNLKSNQDKGRAAAAKHPNAPKMKWARIRNEIKNSSSFEIPLEYTTDRLKLVGSALYWAEGAKSVDNMVNFSNSDPRMINLMMVFFKKVCKVRQDKFRGGVHIHPHLDRKKAEKYWSEVSGIPLNQFHKTNIAVSRASRQKRDTLPLGTFKIVICDVRL
ncbi:MAG: hypothetical protein WC512_06205, partial [Candidatus Omnitrophota bacterium]